MNKEYLDKFKKLYLDKYGIALTDEDATKMATDLINLMKVLLRPTSKPHTTETKEGRQDETFGTQQITNQI